jgi:hypothetical protein
MKKASKFIAVAILLLAAIGAYAASKKQGLSTVFVQVGATCIQKWAVPCDFTGSPLCSVETYNTNDLEDFYDEVQIYQSRNEAQTVCQVAYRNIP